MSDAHGPAPFTARSLESLKAGAPSTRAGCPLFSKLSLMNLTHALKVSFLGFSPSQALRSFLPFLLQPGSGKSFEPQNAGHSPR